MKKGKLTIAVGLVSILLLLFSAGCTADSLKSSQNAPQEEPLTEEVSSTEEVDNTEEESTSGETGASEDETTTGGEGSSGDDATAEDEVEAEPTENPETNCSSLNPHPLAESMTEQFEVTYDQVMTWYCDGAAFSDILLALETVDLADVTVEELLLMVGGQTWEEIWDELGIEK